MTCGERTTDLVSPTTDTDNYEDPTTNPSGFFTLTSPPSGGPFDRDVGMAVIEHDSPLARISSTFATQIDTNTLDSAFLMVSSDGDNIPLDFDWTLGANTVIYINPSNDLSYNTTYILTLRSAHLLSVAVDMLDVDGDEIGGETPDDNIILRFTTIRQGDSFDDRDNDGVYDNLTDLNGDHYWESFGVGEEFWDERPYNHVWDNGEIYIDANNNGHYDPGEQYVDNNGDGTYNPNGETLADNNHNGFADLGEFFNDLDNDSLWDDAESYTDVNGDGEWNDTELRFDRDGDGVCEPEDGDTFDDTETVNGICDYAEPFINADNDSIPGLAWDSTYTHYLVPHWDDAEPVRAGYDYDSDGEYDAGTFLVPESVEPFDPNSVPPRQVYYNGSWVSRRFAGFSETFTDENSDSVWNPADSFLDIIANGVWDATPENLITDLNGNGMYDTSMAGTPVPQTTDDVPPVVISNLYYLIGTNIVATVWMDVSIAIDIADSTYDGVGNRIQQALSSPEFDTTSVILRDSDTRISVPGAISYNNVSTSPTYLRLTFDPSSNLAAGKTYELVLKAQLITDDAGNKLNNTDDILYTFTTTNRTSDGSTVVDDITPPWVVSFVDNGPSFTVTFSEEIDVTTINAATIVVTYYGPFNPGRFVIGRIVSGTSPTSFATTVNFLPNNPDLTGNMAIIKASIKDLAGNRKGSDSTYYW